MSYLYVDSTLGTGGNVYAIKQTGALSVLGAANIYATHVSAALAASSGDIICWSDDHLEVGIPLAGATTGDGYYITSVDHLNCEIEKESTTPQMTSGGDIITSGNLEVNGLNLQVGDDFIVGATAICKISGGKITATGDADKIFSVSGDGVAAIFINPNFNGSTTSSGYLGNGANVEIFGGSTSGLTSYFTTGGFANGGSVLVINGHDLSSITGTMFADVGGDHISDDLISITVNGCQVNAALTGWMNEDFSSYGQRLSVFNSAATSAAAEYQFFIKAFGGFVDSQDDTGIHRDETIAFPSGTKVSAHCLTNTLASKTTPFWFELPAMYAKLSVSTTDKFRLHLASTIVLNNDDVWVEILYADAVNKNEYNLISSLPLNRLATPVELGGGTGATWKNGAVDLIGYNEYRIELDTATLGADCVPIVRIYVGKPSTAIYFDPVFEMVA